MAVGRKRRGVQAVKKVNWAIVGELSDAIKVASRAIGAPRSRLVEEILLRFFGKPTSVTDDQFNTAKSAGVQSLEKK